MSIKLTAIVAICDNKVIGNNNTLPFKLPSDMRNFVKHTKGCPVFMGRKTYESFGKNLPGRLNVVITSDKAYKSPYSKGTSEIVHSVFDAYTRCEQYYDLSYRMKGKDGNIFCIGGAEVYASILAICDKLIVTEIAAEPEGDTTFDIDSQLPNFICTELDEITYDPDCDQYPFVIKTYRRI